MAGMRDKLIRGYFGVDFDSVWDVATNKASVSPPASLNKPRMRSIFQGSSVGFRIHNGSRRRACRPT